MSLRKSSFVATCRTDDLYTKKPACEAGFLS